MIAPDDPVARAHDLIASLRARLASVEEVVDAARTVVGLRREAPLQDGAFFVVVERYHETGEPGIVLRAETPEARALVQAVERDGRVEVRRVLAAPFAGGALAPVLEVLEQKVGGLIASGWTKREDMVPIHLIGKDPR